MDSDHALRRSLAKRLIIDDALPSTEVLKITPSRSRCRHHIAAVLLAQGSYLSRPASSVTFSFAEEAAARSRWSKQAAAYSPIWSYRKGAHPRNRTRPG
jgi:hypothetical protein